MEIQTKFSLTEATAKKFGSRPSPAKNLLSHLEDKALDGTKPEKSRQREKVPEVQCHRNSDVETPEFEVHDPI